MIRTIVPTGGEREAAESGHHWSRARREAGGGADSDAHEGGFSIVPLGHGIQVAPSNDELGCLGVRPRVEQQKRQIADLKQQKADLVDAWSFPTV